MATLIKAMRPDINSVQIRQKPPSLSKTAHSRKQRDFADEIAGIICAEQEKGSDVRAIFVHRDHDNPEHLAAKPCTIDCGTGLDYENLKHTISNKLTKKKSMCNIYPVIVAFETESWWFLWPSALHEYRKGWEKLSNFTGKRVDLISNAKEVLKLKLRPRDPKKARVVPDYDENDSPGIAEKVVTLRLERSPTAIAISYSRFLRDVSAI